MHNEIYKIVYKTNLLRNVRSNADIQAAWMSGQPTKLTQQVVRLCSTACAVRMAYPGYRPPRRVAMVVVGPPEWAWLRPMISRQV